jgi:hypothetical protein
MKDALQNRYVQALLCMLASVGVLILSTKYPTIADELKVAAGSIATLWFSLPGKRDGGPPSGALTLLVLVLALGGVSSCSPKSQQTQMHVAEVATMAANEVGRVMLLQYHAQLGRCVADATNEMEYTICKMAVDQTWGATRVRYASLRRVQAEYADALEKNDIRATDFIEWFRVAYCELRVNAPKSLQIPDVAGVGCAEEGYK